jgi:hypothetical protein
MNLMNSRLFGYPYCDMARHTTGLLLINPIFRYCNQNSFPPNTSYLHGFALPWIPCVHDIYTWPGHMDNYAVVWQRSRNNLHGTSRCNCNSLYRPTAMCQIRVITCIDILLICNNTASDYESSL